MSTFAPYDDARTLLLNANLIDSSLIYFANEAGWMQPVGQTWISFDARSSAVDLIELGGGNSAETGDIYIWIYTPAGQGTDNARMLAKSIINVYTNLPARNPQYQNKTIEMGGMSDDGLFWVTPISITFRYTD